MMIDRVIHKILLNFTGNSIAGKGNIQRIILFIFTTSKKNKPSIYIHLSTNYRNFFRKMQISIPLLCAFIPPLLMLLPVPNSAELFSRQRLPEMDEFSSHRSCYSQNIDPSTWKSLQCPLGNNHCWVATNCKIKKGNETIIIDQRGCTHQTMLNGTNEFYICSLHHYCEKCRVCDEDDYCNGAAGHSLIISVARILMFAIGIVGVEMMLIG